jgi:membrane protease YdiL (CAAX protease family)
MEREVSTVTSDTGVGTGFSSIIKGTLMILFVICSFIVFNVGGYNNFVPGDVVLLTRSAIAGILVLTTLVLYRTKDRDSVFLQISFAFLIASIGLLLAFFFGKWYQLIPGLSTDTVEGTTIAKVAEVIPIVFAILVGTWLIERSYKPVFLTGGNHKKSLGLGLILSPVALIPFFAMGGLGLSAGIETIAAWLPWLCVFGFSNGFMEELMIRGLFLKRYDSLFGQRQSLVLTSVIFAFFHQAVLQYTDMVTFMAFLVVTFLLGLVWGYIMQKSDSIWGAVVAHAVADILLLITVFGV